MAYLVIIILPKVTGGLRIVINLRDRAYRETII